KRNRPSHRGKRRTTRDARETPAPMSEGDPRIRTLLERYCKLAKVKLIARGADLYEMKLPLSERVHFSGRATLRVALSLEALERDPDAEMAVLGSPFLAHLLEAIRTRAGRLSLGTIPPPPHPLTPSPGTGEGGRRRKSRSPSPDGRGGQ